MSSQLVLQPISYGGFFELEVGHHVGQLVLHYELENIASLKKTDIAHLASV